MLLLESKNNNKIKNNRSFFIFSFPTFFASYYNTFFLFHFLSVFLFKYCTLERTWLSEARMAPLVARQPGDTEIRVQIPAREIIYATSIQA